MSSKRKAVCLDTESVPFDSPDTDSEKRDSVSPDEEKRGPVSRKPDSRWMINESDCSDQEFDSDYEAEMKDFIDELKCEFDKYEDEYPLETKQYIEEMKAYEGYYVSDLENAQVCNAIIRADTADEPEFEADLRSATEFAVSEYNKEKKTRLGVKQLVRANHMVLRGSMYYLTFEASDECFYEAKVWSPFRLGFKCEMMRPALYYPARNESYNSLVWGNTNPN